MYIIDVSRESMGAFQTGPKWLERAGRGAGLWVVLWVGNGGRVGVRIPTHHGQGLAWFESPAIAKAESSQTFLSACPDKEKREA